MAIRIVRLKDSTLHARPIRSCRLRVLVAPAYMDRHGRPRSIAELGQHVLLGQPIHAVYYRNTSLIARIASFLNHLSEHWDAHAGGCRANEAALGDEP